MRPIIHFFAKNSLWPNALILMTVTLGVMAIININSSFFPERKTNIITVSIFIPGGSSALENQSNIASSVDEKLANAEGIEDFWTTVDSDKSITFISVEEQNKVDATLELVRDKIGQITTFPPQAIISIQKQVHYEKIFKIALHGNASKTTLMETGNKVYNTLSTSGLISNIRMRGHQQKNVYIKFDMETLLRHKLDLDQVANIIRKDNHDFTLGTINTDDVFFNIRSWNKSIDPAELKKIVIIHDKQKVIRLGELANISFEYPKNAPVTYYNRDYSLIFEIRKAEGDDLNKIAEFIYNYIEEFNSSNESLDLAIVMDQSLAINQGIDQISKNGLSGLILVIIVLGIFLNFRLSIWVSFGVPMSFLGLMIVANILGYTINQLSLLGMIIVVGIIVDDGIVIAENIFTHIQKGKSGLQAAVDGTMEVLPSVASSILTTIIAFVGILYIEGKLGHVVFEMAMVVIITLIASFVEAILVLPGHLVHLKNEEPPAWRQKVNSAVAFVQDKLYVKPMWFLLKWRWASFFTGVVLLISTCLFMVRTNKIHFDLFHNIDQSIIEVNIVLDRESNIKRTEALALEIDQRLDSLKSALKNSDGESIISSTSIHTGASRLETGQHTAQIIISIVDASRRRVHDFEVIEKVQEAIGDVPQAEIVSVGKKHLFGSPVAIQLVSRNEEALFACEKELMDSLHHFKALRNVMSDEIFNSHELNLTLLDKAHLLGIDKAEISRQIRSYIKGITVQKVYENNTNHLILIQLAEQDKDSFNDILNLKIRTRRGKYVPLTELATFSRSHTPEIIKHHNGIRGIKVIADQASPTISIKEAMAKTQNELIPFLKEKYPEVEFLKAGQSKEDEKFQSSIKKIILVVTPLILITMVFSLNSIVQPFLILLMFPIGVLGILFGHWIEDTDVTAMSATGMVSILGIVINDAIVFSDKFNSLIKDDKGVIRAIVGAGKSRFRAIILTSITTVAGLYPLVLEQGIQAEFIKPMAISIVYGTILTTIVILLFYPLLLLMSNDVRRLVVFFKRIIRRRFDLILNGESDLDASYPKPLEVEPAFRRK